jgi:hypothetical protein
MAGPSIQLVVTLGIGSLTCMMLLGIFCGKAQQIRGARAAAERSPLAPGTRSPVDKRNALKSEGVSRNSTQRGRTRAHARRTTWLHIQCEELRRVGFTSAQINRLLTYRAAYRMCFYQPDPLLPGRLDFTRWLYHQGKLSS